MAFAGNSRFNVRALMLLSRCSLDTVLFNTHDVLLLITAGLALLLAIPLAVRREARRAELLLAGFLVTQGISSLYFVFLFNALLQPATLALLYPVHNIPLALTYVLQGLLLLGYSYELAGRRLRLSRADKVALGCWLIATVGTAAAYLADPGGSKSGMVGLAAPFPGLLVSVYFGVRAILVVRTHNREIRQHYSNIDSINLLWLSYAALGFVGIWLLRLSSYVPTLMSDMGTADLIGIISNYPSLLLISWMVVLGLGHHAGPGIRPGTRSDQDRRRDRDADPIQVEKLEALMERVKLYQDPELDLEGLADSMGISARSLSTLINGHYHRNFYDFVNGFRIESAKQQLADPQQQDKSIQRIFEDAGFNSKSTFNTLFKKETGLTPSLYRREVLKTGRADRRSPAVP